MEAQKRREIEANLFPASWAAVEPWDKFPWHLARDRQPDTHKPHSSQALAISVFGTLKTAAQAERDRILAAIARKVGVPGDGPWAIDLEWCDPDNVMKEKRKTQVDAIARSPHAQVLFECKFTEPDGGPCSQKDPLQRGAHKGTIQCNGNYEPQGNTANGRHARCALTGKSIRYWEVIPDVFRYEAGVSYIPCPFSGPWFQWMRNLTVAFETGRASGRKSAFVVAYADAPGLPMADQIHSAEWQRFCGALAPEALPLKPISVQDIAATGVKATAAAGLDAAKWRELSGWLDRRISGVARDRARPSRPVLEVSPPRA